MESRGVPDNGRVQISRRVSWFLLAVGGWNWLIWPRFARAIWADDRSWDDGPTPFFLVHAVLITVSVVLGTLVGALGLRGLRTRR